jgi:hypothetical protein
MVSPGSSHALRIAARLWPPLMCGALLLVANAYSSRAGFDPLTEAQNKRVDFHAHGSARHNQELSPLEADLAEAVLAPEYPGGDRARRLLFLSNSHSFAIMDLRPGDLTAAQWLQVFLSRRATPGAPPTVVRLPQIPNLTTTEFLVRFVAFAELAGHPGDVLVGGIVMAEWRGVGVRDEMASLAETPVVRETLRRLGRENPDLVHAVRALSFAEESSVAAAPRQSAAARFEDRLQGCLEANVSLLRMRSMLHARVPLAFMTMRNRLLGISSHSPRPVPDTTYRASLELLELILRYADSRRISVVLYLAPIRPITPNPNIPADVARFRRDVPETCRRHGARCVDATDAIPASLWTNYPDDGTWAYSGPQRDYAHFTGGAHRVLAELLLRDAGPTLFGSTSQAGGERQP